MALVHPAPASDDRHHGRLTVRPPSRAAATDIGDKGPS
ncbi:hypothetical protein SBD_0194 [Streptomyces bottropensis ATCC 25435]|uniref:Uncharacterized protein n=1 Tax=Streptomyces bottropensis ATCC 25435 TaxID=1054862 RepID=M3DKV1_9ACTN|nr:hypothetical protein SBD_0194 [Streptomyces bottropensis ATCC 25435]